MKKSRKWITGVLLCGLVLGLSGCQTAKEEPIPVDIPGLMPSEENDVMEETTDSSIDNSETESAEMTDDVVDVDKLDENDLPKEDKEDVEVLEEEADIESPENGLTEVKDGSVCFKNVSFKYSKIRRRKRKCRNSG